MENKNVFFGMNDVGKTNFMNALRFVFDRNTRKNNLAESDFYKKQIDEDDYCVLKDPLVRNNQQIMFLTFV